MSGFKWCLVILVVAVVGCVTTTIPMAADEMDKAAKTFSPAEGKANLYIVRTNSFVGSAISPDISVDGKLIGTATQGSYFLVSLDEWVHTIVGVSKWGSNRAKVEVEAGSNYFYNVSFATTGITTSLTFTKLDEESGKAAVQKCRLAENMAE
jgi:hypothetical protein